MAKKEYVWEPGGDPPKIKQHSIAKHEVLRGYLIAYFRTLTSSPMSDTLKLSLIDGFSGGGLYKHSDTGKILSGSPLIMIEASEEAEFRINQTRHKPLNFEIDYFFVDEDAGACEYLKNELHVRGHGSKIGDQIHVLQSDFEQEIDEITEHILKKSPRAARAIFLLDQYGYSQVPIPRIRSIFSQLPGAEVILTFAVDSFLNFATDSQLTTKNLEGVGLPDVFRGRTIEDIKGSERDWRLFIQSAMHRDLVHGCGARFYTTFFIRSSQGHGDYWLVHLSQRPRARDVMTQIHWEQSNYFIHYGGSGIDMFNIIGYVPEHDEAYTGQPRLSFGFEFDDPAKASSTTSLMEQIPDLIYPDDNGMSFAELFTSTCNYSPASRDIYAESLGQLIGHSEIEVRSQSGVVRRSGNAIHDSDQILPPQQRSLFLTPKKK